MTSKSVVIPQIVSSTPEKKSSEDRQPQYAVISKDSIRVYGEACNHSNLNDDVTAMLAEDVSYRLRQVVQVSSQYMRHCRRSRLTQDDVNMGLQCMDTEPILGHGSTDSVPFIKIKDTDLYHTGDTSVSLADVCNVPVKAGHCPHTTLSAEWTVLDGIPQPPPANTTTPALSEPLNSYYTHITQAILSSDSELVKISLNDLRTNPKISPLLPYLVSFVSNGVKSSSHDVGQMMKLLHTIRAITANTHLNLHPIPYLQQLTDTALYCLLEPLAASINPLNDHWILRDYASNLLSFIKRRWSSGQNHLEADISNKLQRTLQDLTKPYCCHYGAVMGFIALGHKHIEDILMPELSAYWSHLDLTLNDPSCANTPIMADALKVHGALLLAADKILQLKIQRFKLSLATTNKQSSPQTMSGQTNPNPKPEDNKQNTMTEDKQNTITEDNIRDFYAEMYEYFGDALSLRLADFDIKYRFKAAEKTECVNLGDEDTNKTGEELLAEFMRQGVKTEEPTDVLTDAELRIRQARSKFASQKTFFAGTRSGVKVKREDTRDDRLYGGVKRSRLQEEWCDEVRRHGGHVTQIQDESSRSSDCSDSVHSEKSHDMSYPSVDSEISDPADGMRIKIKMATTGRASPFASDSPDLTKVEAVEQSEHRSEHQSGRRSTHHSTNHSSPDSDREQSQHQFGGEYFTKIKHTKYDGVDYPYQIPKLEPQSPKRESHKHKTKSPTKK